MNENIKRAEEKLQALIGELQQLLTDALNALDMKALSPETRYLASCGVTVNQAAGGYYTLSRTKQKYAAKFLIRPMLEATLAACAVMKKKGFLFRKLYTELTEEKKSFPKTLQTETHFEKMVDEMESFLKSLDPAYPVERKKVDIRYTAEIAELLPLYEHVYRIYCRFTHASMDAALGQLDQITDDLDAHFVAAFLMTILEQLKDHARANVPALSPYRSRLEALAPRPKEASTS